MEAGVTDREKVLEALLREFIAATDWRDRDNEALKVVRRKAWAKLQSQQETAA